MASRENQRYLIAIIVLSLLMIGFFIATLLGWSKAFEYSDVAKGAENKLKLARAMEEAYSAKASILETMIGANGGSVAEIQTTIDSMTGIARKVDSGDKSKVDAVAESVASIKALYDQDMKSNSSAGAEDAAAMTYKNLIANLNSVLAKMHNELIVKTKENVAYRVSTDAKLAQVRSELAASQTSNAESQKQLEETKNASLDKERELKNKMATQQESIEKSQESFARQKDVALQEKNTLIAQKATITEERTNLKKKVDFYESEVFNIPDGDVIKVSGRLNSVVLSIGRVDGLRVNQSFAIYDQSVSNFEKGRHKASVEVTRLVGDKEAEAKITEQNPLNPILEGDLVLSPVWDPGFSTPMALAGDFDLDNDGRPDNDKLRQMIKLNGGTVKVYHDDQGNITGKIDPSIRYLVIGAAPVEGPNANPEVVEAMKILEEQAESNTVQVIDMRKLLNWMGFHGRARVEKLGGNVDEFQSRSPSIDSGSDTRSGGSGTR